MAKQDIIISIQLKGAEGVSKSTDKVANSQKHLREMMSRSAVELEKLNIKKKRQKELNVQIAKSELGYSEAVGKTASQLKASKTQAGLNNAILLESGRLASDASYGFTAMANNLSQLVSLFGSFAKTSGGMLASLKDLGKSLMGTGGVLLAVQLLIGALQSKRVLDFVKSFNGLSPRLRELTNLTEGYSKATEELVGNFNIYIGKLLDSNQSEQQKAIALEKLNKEYPDFNASILTSAQNTDEATAAVERYIEKLKEQALSRAAIQEYQKVQGEQDEELYEVLLKQQKAEDDLAYQRIQLQKAEQQANDNKNENLKIDFAERVGQIQRVITETENAIKNYKEESTTIATEYKKRLDIIDDYIILVNDKNKKGYGNRERDFKQHLLNLDKLEESYRQKAIDKELMTRDELINLEEKNAKAELKIRVDAFKAKQKLRLEEFEEGSELRETEALKNITDEGERKKIQDKFIKERLSANDEYNESIRLADVEHDEVMIELTASFNTKRAQLRRTEFEEQMAEQERIQELERQTLDAKAALMDEQSGIVGDYAFFERQRNVERMNEDIERAERVVRMEKEGSEAKAQAELSLHQLKKQLSEEEQAIQEEKFGFIMEQYQQVYGALSQTFEVTAQNQTIELEENYARRIEAAEGNADEQDRLERELAVKKDKIARKQFERDKAMRVSSALMTVYQNGFLAYGSQLFPGDVTSPVRAAIQQAITIAAGLANVANIARQKYQSKVTGGGASSGGSAGGGRSIQAPDFNVVGASQTSQLAQAVTTQQEKPVKAFVVGKDISTQQELDRNITNTASFG
jgi:hypothetical protein